MLRKVGDTYNFVTSPVRWHLDEVFVKINGQMRYLWRAVDHEGEVLESYVTETRDKASALKFIKKALKMGTRTCFSPLRLSATRHPARERNLKPVRFSPARWTALTSGLLTMFCEGQDP